MSLERLPERHYFYLFLENKVMELKGSPLYMDFHGQVGKVGNLMIKNVKLRAIKKQKGGKVGSLRALAIALAIEWLS